MPRVNHVKARKDYPEQEIKRGEMYYNWRFRFSKFTNRSKVKPRRSQLTQSGFLSQLYDLEDRVNALSSDSCVSDIRSEVEGLAEEIRTLGEEQIEKRDNMPESLQDSPNGELLQERSDGCEEWADELEGIDFDSAEEAEEAAENPPEGEDEDELGDALEQAKEDVISELQGCTYNGS